jgi:integrase
VRRRRMRPDGRAGTKARTASHLHRGPRYCYGGRSFNESAVPDMPTAGPDPAIAQLYAAWLGGLSELTRRAYARDLQAYADLVTAESPQAAVAALLASGAVQATFYAQAWRNAMLAGALAPATINGRLAALRSVLELARTLGLVPWSIEFGSVPEIAQSNYKAQNTRRKGRKLPVCLLETEVATLLDAAQVAENEAKSPSKRRAARRNRLIVMVGLYMGLRISEILNLRVEHIDLDRGQALIFQGKDGKDRYVPVRDDLAAELGAWIDGRLEGLVFPSPRGGRLTSRAAQGHGEEAGARGPTQAPVAPQAEAYLWQPAGAARRGHRRRARPART